LDSTQYNITVLDSTEYNITVLDSTEYNIVTINDSVYVVSMEAFDETVSVAEDTLVTINMYPNPTKDMVKIQSSYNIMKINLYDISGKLLITDNPNTLDYELKVQEFDPGLYIIKIYITDKKGITLKVQKE